MQESSYPKRLVIYGARRDGSAKVVLDIIRLGGEYEVVGFLDDNADLWTEQIESLPVWGGGEELNGLEELNVRYIAFAIGNNELRELLLKKALACHLTPINAVHPRAVVAKGVRMGIGIWIAGGAVVNPGVVIGNGVVINTGATVDHDCVLSDYSNISPGCHLSGRTVIERYAFLGTGAITLPDVVVGEGAIVAAGAVVLKHVPARTTVVGVPARELPQRSHAQGKEK